MNTFAPNLLEALGRRSAPVHLWQGRGRLTTWSADGLRKGAERWAGMLQAHDVSCGAVVATCAPTSLKLVAAVLGAWQAGAAVMVLPEPAPGAEPSLSRAAEGLHQVQPNLLLLDGTEAADLIGGVPCALQLSAAGTEMPPATRPVRNGVAADALALMQLTSGSTGRAKVVPMTHRMLGENCLATAHRLQVRQDDHMLSWLPLTHDMGFCGALCLALASDIQLTLLPTENGVHTGA